MGKAKVCITVALSVHDRGIGKGGKLLWHIPDDLRRFKQLTLGHPVIMGRKTFDSIVALIGHPLPGRTNIVVTRQDICIDGALTYHSLEEALEAARAIEADEVHIGGGAEIYAEALPYTDRLYLTLIEEQKPADTFFPDYADFTKIISTERREYDGLRYTWLTLER